MTPQDQRHTGKIRNSAYPTAGMSEDCVAACARATRFIRINDMTEPKPVGSFSHASPDGVTARPMMPAVLRGAAGCCPACGGKTLFFAFLKVSDRCPQCGTELHHHRADDMPSWATILIVGHIVIPLIFVVERTWKPELWVHWLLWPALIIGLTLLLLPRLKGGIVGLQWAMRLHGFGRE